MSLFILLNPRTISNSYLLSQYWYYQNDSREDSGVMSAQKEGSSIKMCLFSTQQPFEKHTHAA